MSAAPLLQLLNISKGFGGVVALDDVSLAVQRGEVVALIGENGAGKSTLMKILGGVHQPDAGTIRIDDREVQIRGVADAVALGVGFVHQELSNLDNLDVAGNLFLGREPLRGGPLKLLDHRKMAADSVPHLRRLGLTIDARTPMRTLSLAQQQMVEIAKALSQEARILVLDEPTSSLTAAETDTLLRTVCELRGQGVSVIYVSHRLAEIRRIADRVVALRDGRNAGELGKQQINHESMVRLMIGRDLRSFYAPRGGGSPRARDGARLQVRNLRTATWPTRTIDLDAHGGEILGIAGLVGSGRSELAQALFGVVPRVSGALALDGRELKIRNPADAIAAGIYLAPEDRRQTGLIMSMTVCENITLPELSRRARAGLIRRAREASDADAQIRSLRIKTPSRDSRVTNLSGGNQQKVALGKWLALSPKVLIVDEPTRGIDVGAKAEIYRLLRALADEGVAVIMISSDMEEVLGISDRIAVMHEGAMVGTLLPPEYSEQAVLDLAFGYRTGTSASQEQE
jgi:ribose transport system ATP-binding protein